MEIPDKTRCWDSNANLIGHFDLQLIAGYGDDALVMYVLRIKTGKTITNIEHSTCGTEKWSPSGAASASRIAIQRQWQATRVKSLVCVSSAFCSVSRRT
jgi:hypothetical protein